MIGRAVLALIAAGVAASCAQVEAAPGTPAARATPAAVPVAASASVPAASAPAAASVPAAPAPPATLCAELPETIVPQQWLALPAVDVRGRRPFRADAVFARYLLDPAAPAPQAGESLTGETGEPQAWEARQAEPDGALKGDFAWGYTAVTSPAPRVMLAELSGAATLFVNGDGASGDPYRSGFGASPVALRAGVNHLYVAGVRDEGCRLVLRQPEHALRLELSDTTAPDLVDGEAREGELALTIVNASLKAVPRLTAATGGEGVFADVTLRDDELPGLPPLAVIKLPLRFALRADAALPAAPADVELTVRVGGHPDEPARAATLKLPVRAADAPRRVTRRSGIDDSVQEYSLRAPAAVADAARLRRPGLVLTLHGAGVDALAQASSYSAKRGWWIVAPTNRRNFGFDWQDWGRLDAYETLEDALALTGADPARVALTGHSMGGHGSWHLAVNDPDRFIAVAPSAGWASFDSYPGRPEGARAALWHAADGASETLALLPNLVGTPVYVLHGSADDNVPASEGQALFDALTAAVAAANAAANADGRAASGATADVALAPQLHIQEGAGHWWDGEASPGVDCVDWPPIFALFDAQPHELPWPARFEWVCADPATDGRNHWISVIQPQAYGQPVHIAARWDAAARHVELTTRNAGRLLLHWPDGAVPASCRIDGQDVQCGSVFGGAKAVPDTGDVLEWSAGGWEVSPADVEERARSGWDPAEKSPSRSGPFKRAFDNRFVLVYGTAGDEREDAELLARARFDSEQWRYRGNGCAPLWSDAEFLAPGNLPRMAGRNVIVYGNRDTNLAYQALVPSDCPLQAERGRIRLGTQSWEGDDLAAVCVYPRAGDATALLGLFADSGPSGSRLGYTLAPFTSGVGYPDFAVFSASVLADGDGGVRAAGWFDRDWRP